MQKYNILTKEPRQLEIVRISPTPIPFYCISPRVLVNSIILTGLNTSTFFLIAKLAFNYALSVSPSVIKFCDPNQIWPFSPKVELPSVGSKKLNKLFPKSGGCMNLAVY